MSYDKENITDYVKRIGDGTVDSYAQIITNIVSSPDYHVDNPIEKKHKESAEYMDSKYRSAYIGAIAKLNAPNRFDEKGLLKREYELTDAERDALKYYVPVENTSINNDVNGRKIR